ncbi:ClpXP protease specificity-enhancing factor [Candidatus Pandoraea novymonadis]|uniref:Stringent starvation protein B n=1 Tax=Candidatus Pandoraea novymonadis TaxID=1808959 RepID=A0ABX5FCN8_9BURK|nr:ClpXP protease specificity-enhancing factor [Candidatus Pandoraea novymonadis]PSB91596.1 Stringent starvation protein B [Candidatus Pandoraea novymonadis]
MLETSTKPYLLRALYEWCVDNGYTPHLSVHVDASTKVPRNFVKNGEIVLNISFDATSGLQMGNDWIEFSARFGGIAQKVEVQVANVLAMYARENGQGIAFSVNQISPLGGPAVFLTPLAPDGEKPDPSPPISPQGRRAHLKVVK